MLYDRPYMRHQPANGEPRQLSAVTALLIATLAVFILQHLLNAFFPGPAGYENGWLYRWFSLSGEHFREGNVWTVFSYGFLHDTHSLLHIFGNLLGLFFVGRFVEPALGKRSFLFLYFGGMLIGGLLYLTLHINGNIPVVGASAAVLAVVAFFCLLRPEQPITLLLFFVLPVTVKPKWLFWGLLVFSAGGVLFYELPGQSHVAHSAHLGGILAAVLFFHYVYNRRPGSVDSSGSGISIELPEWVRRQKQSRKSFGYRVNRKSRDEVQKEVDRILDKINQSGFGSLTEEERRTLDRARDLLSR